MKLLQCIISVHNLIFWECTIFMKYGSRRICVRLSRINSHWWTPNELTREFSSNMAGIELSRKIAILFWKAFHGFSWKLSIKCDDLSWKLMAVCGTICWIKVIFAGMIYEIFESDEFVCQKMPTFVIVREKTSKLISQKIMNDGE